jgi:hypothetical protein
VPANASKAQGQAIFQHKLVVASIDNVTQSHIHRTRATYTFPWSNGRFVRFVRDCGMEDALSLVARFWHEIAARPDGPMAFRFYLQPLMAMFFAVRDGLRDAREGRPAYGWSLFTAHSGQERRTLMHDAWRSVGKVFILACVLDIVYQIIVLKGLRPVETLFVATILALVPYILLRGPVNRLARHSRRGHTPKERHA